jgi:class 3 adenylate cyclase
VEADAPRSRRKLAAILMVDVSGFSRLMEQDEEWTTREIRAFHARAEARVREHEGRVVDTAGDSVFAEFDSVVNATRCAQAIQEDQAAANRSQDPSRRIDTRIGVHVGDVIVEEYKVYGDGVNIAARLESLAQPGHILVSEAVYQQVRNKIPAQFRDEGVRTLKNIEHPVRVYSLVPSSLVPSQAPAGVRPPSRRERRERRLEQRARSHSAPRPAEPPPRGLLPVLLRPDILTTLAIGVGLLASPSWGLNTAGVLPTGGAILVGLSLGRALGLRRRRPMHLLGLGTGIALGAHFTHWSRITDFMFILAGAIVAAQGIVARRMDRDRERLPPG